MHVSKKKMIRTVFVIVFCMVPLLSAILFCLKDGRWIGDVYIQLGGWSDEITYYKQIEGILSYGMPRGFFGYNQSRALYGSLGVWGMIPLIPYVVWGGIFGWNYSSPIFANIFFCMIAFVVLFKVMHLTGKEMGALSIFWVTNQFINRYVLSGVVEASVIMQLILVTACGEYLLSEKIRDRTGLSAMQRDQFVLGFCTFMICMLTLARPYFAVLFLIPFWKAVQDRRKKWIMVLPVLAVGTIAVFFLYNHFFCSTYFNNIFSFEKLYSAGILGAFAKVFDGFMEIARLMWYAMRYKGSGVGWYYLLLFIELATMLFVCIRNICQHKKPPRMFTITLIGNVMILLSIIEMYDLGVGGRHILALIVVNAVLLVVEVHFSMGAVLALVCIVSIVQTKGADALPYQNEDYVAYMDSLEKIFSEVVEVTEEISYESVVAMPTADRSTQYPEQGVSTYYGLLFAMPPGVGISLDYRDYYDDPNHIKAGYIMVHPAGEIRKILEDMGMTCVFENEELALYKNTMSY